LRVTEKIAKEDMNLLAPPLRGNAQDHDTRSKTAGNQRVRARSVS
jgi:hypothetical protein